MSNNSEKDYPLVSDLSEADLDENSSLKKMSRLVGDNKQVIDFGCATGYFAQLLKSKGCQVTGVEINPSAAKVAEQYCQQVIVADLDFVSLSEILPQQTFDVAVFGDVLEHLRDPWKVLQETKQLLKPEGYVVASIPNIAHGAIRLALLQGRFDYMELGILDNTHLRFFTRKTVEQLFDDSGYFVDVIKRTKLPIFSGSNWIPEVEKNHFDSKIIKEIEEDKDADTLQFAIRAFPLSLEGKYAALEEKYAVLNKQHSQVIEEMKCYQTQMEQVKFELEQAQIQLQERKEELARSQSQIQEQKEELARSQSQIQQQQVEIDRSQGEIQEKQMCLNQAQGQLHQTKENWECSQNTLYQIKEDLDRSLNHLQQVQMEWEKTQIQLQQAHAGWEYCQNRIQAMETSKFWKIRLIWFKIKRLFGLKVD